MRYYNLIILIYMIGSAVFICICHFIILSCLKVTYGVLYDFNLFFLFVVDFVIHWNETAMGLHVFPIPIPPLICFYVTCVSSILLI